jgi:alanyl-tRNA synthetase
MESMKADEIRRRFLQYFQERGHELRPSSSLVPADDPTLLFTNAGMVQFKQVFLGQEEVPWDRAVTSQKCVRAGGKHNDLEQVGRTARHHTFFEMLGNFSFGDYFKREAIGYAWEFITGEMGLDPDRLYSTVHHTDDEAYVLWQEVAGLDPSRIHRLGDEENFWQMADTGPCGPCSEIHYDLRPEGERSVPDTGEFEALGDQGEILELWNLVFMQFDRSASGELNPLPSPSIDTGLGLERLAAVMQEAGSNYHTDLFTPLLERVGRIVGRPYDPEGEEGVSFRVLADHARAVAFLLSDGVLPSNEGRGYVLRRILRRGVRHAWLLGRREPTLAEVVDEVVSIMGDAYPDLRERREKVLQTTRLEEERFLATIEGGMTRFEELAPTREPVGAGEGDAPVIPGDEAFKLYDTYGFPLDLTQVMAEERGYRVDEEGFEKALETQRARSRADRAAAGAGVERSTNLAEWTLLADDPEQEWVGWDATEAETRVLGFLPGDPEGAQGEGADSGLLLEKNPFYAEAGGQVSDTGVVEGEGWRFRVRDVGRAGGQNVLFGTLEGEISLDRGPLAAVARVDRASRMNTERNHTVTHLLHAALRQVLGDHVGQRGSLVAPERLRFDFSHSGPMTPDELARVEEEVNRAIWEDHPVRWEILSYDEAVSRGAMALFGEKYGDEVRMVEIPGVSRELCGGTHLERTAQAGLFTIVKEGGVAAGVRRIEAVTGPGAYRHLRAAEEELDELARRLKATRENLPRRLEQLQREREELESLVDELRRGDGAGETVVHDAEVEAAGGDRVRYRGVRLRVKDADDARRFGDAFRERESMAAAALATEAADGKRSLFVFVTDDLIGRGVRAGDLIRGIAEIVGGRGGGRPHMAQGGIEYPERVDDALRAGEGLLRDALRDGT